MTTDHEIDERPLTPNDAHERLGCYRRYGFLSGYTLRARMRLDAEPSCDDCPMQRLCWTEHLAIVESNDPQGVALFRKLIKDVAHRHNMSLERAGELTKAQLLRQGTPDPYAALLYANASAGIDARRLIDEARARRRAERN